MFRRRNVTQDYRASLLRLLIGCLGGVMGADVPLLVGAAVPLASSMVSAAAPLLASGMSVSFRA